MANVAALLTLRSLNSRKKSVTRAHEEAHICLSVPRHLQGMCNSVMGTPEQGWTGLLAFPQVLSSYRNSTGAGCLILPGLQEKVSCVPWGLCWCKCSGWKTPGRRKGHFQDSHVLKGKMDGMKPGGRGEPFWVNEEFCQKTAEGAVQQELQRREKNLARDAAWKMEHFILGKLNVSIKNDRAAIL